MANAETWLGQLTQAPDWNALGARLARAAAVAHKAALAPVAAMLALTPLRFLKISHPRRIGHLVSEVDCHMMETALELIPAKKPVIFLARDEVANPAVLELFRAHYRVWDGVWTRRLLGPLREFDALTIDTGRSLVGLRENARYFQIRSLWGEKPPLMRLPEDLRAQGRRRLVELGVPENAWFVCAHARSAGYSPVDESENCFRNVDIETYGAAFDAIVERGGWVVRVGDPTMAPLNPRANAVDYARSELRAPWMDVFLLAEQRFFLGCASGPLGLPLMFGKPCALTNMAPLGACLGGAPGDLSIPKRLFDRGGREVSYPEMFASGLSMARTAGLFNQFGFRFVDNTPEEIRALVLEMLDRLDGRWATTPEDEELQRRFRGLFQPRDYAFGSRARLGRDFLRARAALLAWPPGLRG